MNECFFYDTESTCTDRVTSQIRFSDCYLHSGMPPKRGEENHHIYKLWLFYLCPLLLQGHSRAKFDPTLKMLITLFMLTYYS